MWLDALHFPYFEVLFGKRRDRDEEKMRFILVGSANLTESPMANLIVPSALGSIVIFSALCIRQPCHFVKLWTVPLAPLGIDTILHCPFQDKIINLNLVLL